MADRAAYPEAIGIFRGTHAALDGAPILAVDPDDWDGAEAVFDAARIGGGNGATDWSFGPGPDGVPHAVLSFSTLEPPTHILLALSVQEPMHLGALAAAVTTGHVMLAPLAYLEAMPADGEPLATEGAPFVQVQIDAERVRAFLADPDSARP